MAEIKYLSLERLSYYDGKIKGYIDAADAATLAAANKYFEDNAVRFDPAGTAATKVQELAEGAVADNTAAIGVLNGEGEGSVKKAIADAKALIDADVAGVDGKADAAQAAADKAQGEVDALEEYVGTFTHESAETVIEYIDAKVLETSTNADSAVGALTERMVQAEKDIDAIEADYLKAADKKELSDAIKAEEDRAKGIEGGLETRLAAVEADYLVEVDKTELQGNIDGVNAKVTTLIGEDANKSVRTIANEELAKQLIAEGAKESLDTLKEIADWIQKHPDDAAAMNKAIEDLEALVGTLPEGITATTVVGYIEELVAAERERAVEAEGKLDTRLKVVEAMFDGEGDGTVAEQIATAKQEAIDAAAADATSKANAAEAAAKGHADSLNTAMNTRVEALEAIDHDHSNKTVIDGITAEKVAAWDAAEQNAKDYADGKDAAIAEAKKAGDDAAAAVKTLEEGQVATNKSNIEDIDGRVAALESVTHVAITEEEINALFA